MYMPALKGENKTPEHEQEGSILLLKGCEPSISSKEGKSQEEILLSGVIKWPNFQFSQPTVTSGAGDVRELGFQKELLTLPHSEKLHGLAFPYKTLSSLSCRKDFSCFISADGAAFLLLSGINTTVPDSIHSENSY